MSADSVKQAIKFQRNNCMKKIIPILLLFLSCVAQSQITIGDTFKVDYTLPKEYTIGGLRVEGAPTLDNNLILSVTGLMTGQKVRIPGDDISNAISNLWKQGLFDDISINAEKVQGENIFLVIKVQERPRLSKFKFTKGSISKSDADDIRDEIKLQRGKTITDYVLQDVKNKIKVFYSDKGYLDAIVDILPPEPDSSAINSVILTIDIKKGKKIKIGEIYFYGNTEFSNGKLWRTMKETKRKRWWNPFNSAKLIDADYEKDKISILEKYNARGYRDAEIVKDTLYRIADNRMVIGIYINEGKKYFFRNISFVGNSKYPAKKLATTLGIKKGDVYNQAMLESKLYMSANGTDISSLYMDDGYLFFNVQPIEVLVEGDSIDLEIRIVEGKQATINKVTVSGNTKTNDRVIMREIRTRPGQLFRRSDVIRTQRELAQLGYFDQEKMQINPIPNPVNGTVDIDYVVEEKPSDQIELSGGFGGGRVIGTLGVSFNNFSARNMFKKGAWGPLPSGDGQRLSVRAQSNGLFYQSYNMSFTEPWLGGKKPNSFSISVFHSIISNGQKSKVKNSEGIKVDNPLRRSIDITGVAVGLGTRMKKPDDYFQFYGETSYNYYVLNNYNNFVFANGYANNVSFKTVFSRNSVDQPLFDFPTSGSNISLTTQFTPPYSSFNGKSYEGIEDQERYKWIEFYKVKFTTSWFTRLLGKERKNSLVLNTRAGFGFLGYYKKEVGISPFERFYLGGSGLSGLNMFDSREIIALRGYDDGSVSPFTGASTIVKYTLELRYPISLNPAAMVYGLTFAEAGNSWMTLREFNPFDVRRSAGVGVRIFLPMFGLLGFDYGWRLDTIPNLSGMARGQFHFTIGMNLGEL